MSDIKYCPSCGTTLALSAAFCHNCGQKQKVSEAEPLVSKENTAPVTEEQAQSQAQEQSLGQSQAPEQVQTQILEQELVLNQTHAQAQAPEKKPVQAQAPEQTHAQAPVHTQTQAPASAQGMVPPVQQTQNQPANYPQQSGAKKEIKKKKFPWFFTILWFILFLAVGAWGYYLYYLFSVGGDYPQFTEDAQRIVLFTVSFAILIYTLSLKLTMKKLKAFPTVLLVIALLVVFYLFCMVELTDGDWLHDTISEITDNILPAFGE